MADTSLLTGGNLMQALKTRMQWHESRQKVLASNVANADTPRYRPLELKALSVAGTGSVAMAQTDAGHMGTSSRRGAFDSTGAGRFETLPNGNAVSLEDEMAKVAQNQSDYQLAASLYSKSLGLMKIAIGKGR